MLGTTHSLSGLVTGLQLASMLHADPAHALLIAGAAAFGALLPDIDHPASTVGRRVRIASIPVSMIFRHRGMTHSLIALALIGFLGIHYHPVYGLALAAGYAAHLLGDAMTRGGIMLIWPFEALVYALPKPMRLKTGGVTERLIYIALLTAMVWFFWNFQVRK